MPNDWLTLLALVFAFGARHGFDADHLATIDGLTRFNARAHPRLARYCGTLFSLGHGGVVVLVAVVVSSLATQWVVPTWFEWLGSWISIGFLYLLAYLNLSAVATAKAGEVVRMVGLRGRLLGGLSRSSNPLVIAGVGALFALSFDTLSQAALFALTATRFGGWEHGLVLGLCFTLGMLICDGINGLWIARLVERADRLACIASRILGLCVGGIAFAVASLGVLKLLLPPVENALEGSELPIGFAVIALVAGAAAVGSRWQGRNAEASRAA